MPGIRKLKRNGVRNPGKCMKKKGLWRFIMLQSSECRSAKEEFAIFKCTNFT